MTPLTIKLARDLIEAEENDHRFEAFANAIVSEIEGTTVALTSLTNDMGRDGRTVGPAPTAFVCSSLNDEPSPKAVKDVKRLGESPVHAERVYFCSSQRLTEKAKDEITVKLRAELSPGTSVEVMGSTDLAHFAALKPGIFLAQYQREVDERLRERRLEEYDTGDVEMAAMRLAVSTLGHSESSAIRDHIYLNAIREALSGKRLNASDCARTVSDTFRLHRALSATALLPYLEQLKTIGDISVDQGRYELNDAGKAALSSTAASADEQLAKGEKVIRAQLQSEVGVEFTDEQFAPMWITLRDKIASLFYSRGYEMVSAVSEMLNEQDRSPRDDDSQNPPPDARLILRELASSVAASCSNKDLAQDVRRGLIDIFTEGVGPAFEWLVEACAAYVSLCTLGLEATSGRRLRLAVSKLSLALDTDVLLSLLGEGEPDHAAVRELTRHWRDLGGAIVVAPPVLEEAAHHAWIANRDFREVASWLPGSADDRLRCIQNAFVRAFAELRSRRATMNNGHWQKYLEQFRGASNYDYAPILEELRSEQVANSLPSVSRELSDEERKVFEYCQEQVSAEGNEDQRIKEDKARRDAELFVALQRYNDRLRSDDTNSRCFLVSSGRRLAELEVVFGTPGDASCVFSVRAILAILALVPGVSVSLPSLSTLLFEGSFHRATGLKMTLRRVLKESRNNSMPWARRTRLERAVHEEVVRVAREREGSPSKQRTAVRDLERDIRDGQDAESAARIINRAMEAVAIDSKTEIRLQEANARIAELEGTIKRMRDARRS